MENDMYGAQRGIWNMLRARKKPVDEHVQLNQVSAKQWEQYHTELYNNEESENDSEGQADQIEEEESDKKNPSNYRTITLPWALTKLFTGIFYTTK
ncbi:hypothetical protein HHI36_023112 [Cryptolaemus montrouzieri]|uniref:Uncharacterized protein n=1 Tax=Cryptolaemus montrouzieri TaxID=559131 RepID=A0ABD2PFZ6_9CUCU